MIAFFDTSAIVPLFIEEQSSDRCRRVWDAADAVVCVQLAYVEIAAALSRATRLERMTAGEHARSLELLESLWDQVDVMPVDEALVREAAALTLRFPLRGYDAVHCAGALRIVGNDVVAVSGDRELLAAWRGSALDVVDTQL